MVPCSPRILLFRHSHVAAWLWRLLPCLWPNRGSEVNHIGCLGNICLCQALPIFRARSDVSNFECPPDLSGLLVPLHCQSYLSVECCTFKVSLYHLKSTSRCLILLPTWKMILARRFQALLSDTLPSGSGQAINGSRPVSAAAWTPR
ncbi:hypothetical protein N657DRAFT_395429 [Parathielavia appendiculata]|uniref:Secreted protein n=1 Tax=Parathielavia appendiculata TaxID=2587402 RepID=A0AAN6Z4H1_9PEZI|nr:hypothetical protein N657DRAFT_395429 [Parathielavia appendiculata]